MKNAFSSLSELGNAFGKNIDDTTQDTTSNMKLDSNAHSDNTLVYSTDSGRIKDKKNKNKIPQSDGFARVRRETKGRKGKGVIVIAGLGLSTDDLKKLASKLKKTCGSGGSVVGETIEVQGDKRELIKTTLEKQGFKVKFVGG